MAAIQLIGPFTKIENNKDGHYLCPHSFISGVNANFEGSKCLIEKCYSTSIHDIPLDPNYVIEDIQGTIFQLIIEPFPLTMRSTEGLNEKSSHGLLE